MDSKDNTKTIELKEYLETLNEKQRISLEIAKEHLGTSFDYYRCNGFVEWKKSKSVNLT